MHYAVDYADVGETKIARWQDSEEPTAVILKDFSEKVEFLRTINRGDTIWMELGGTGDVFAQVAIRNGASVSRIPAFLLKDERESRGSEKENDHLILASLASQNPQAFYPMRPVDEAIVRLRVFVRARTVVQRTIRIPTRLRLTRVYRDLYLVDNPEEALDAYLKGRIAQNPIFQGAEDYEQELNDQIKKLLKDIPVYEEIFQPIHGCGPVIGGTIIARIVDIRRFHTVSDLTAYAGYHLTTDGEVARQRRGIRANWDPSLKQAIWNFCDVTNRQSAETVWKKKLLERKAHERSKHPESVEVDGKRLFTDGHIHNRALRFLGQKFIRYIWREWRGYEGLS